jgi:catechol 2,3-dioxygenase-like lactoylglutathione lyase family enzyme
VNARVQAIVLDCPDPKALAAFYSGLTGWPIVSEDGEWIDIKGDGDIALSFQLAPDHQPPQWPNPDRPQQFHIDFEVDDYDTAQARALELGATLLEGSENHSGFRVYADPAGHPFCLCISH